MKKSIVVLVVIISIFLSSCGIKANNLRVPFKSEKQIKQVLEDVLSCIDEKNTDKLENLFSKTAQSECNSFDEDIQYLFDFLKGEVVEIIDEGEHTSEDIEYGKINRRIEAWYYVNTTADKYLVFMVYYPKYDTDKNMQGLYTLRIIRKDNEDEEFFNYYTEDLEIAGIYNPT